MRRVIIGVAASLALAACGSGDDDAAPAAESEESAEESAGEPTEEATGEATDEATEEMTEEVDEPSEEPEPEPEPTDDDDRSVDTVEIDSLADVPPECMDLFVTYLKDIEPFVEDIDWETATLDEMSQLGTEFETLSTDFDEESTRIGCDQYTFDDEGVGFDEFIEVARREAPGTVGFFEFINEFSEAAEAIGDGGDGGDGGVALPDAPETCDEAVTAIEELLDQYPTINEVPAGEVMTAVTIVSSLTTVCTFEELDEIYQRQDISDFLAG